MKRDLLLQYWAVKQTELTDITLVMKVVQDNLDAVF